MKSLIIIPARYASSRLPAKPLLVQTGKPLLQHTWEQAKKSTANQVIIATDDDRIAQVAKDFGADVAMTSPDHESGTARVAEVAKEMTADVIVNMQGDEPEVDPAHLDALINLHSTSMASVRPAFASTLVCPFGGAVRGLSSPDDPSCVKAVLSAPQGGVRRALYFSRSLVPYPRDAQGTVKNPADYYLHIGLYAFSPQTLQKFNALPLSRLEAIEKLEQLRILEAGEDIAAAIVSHAAPGIDTPEDYAAFVARYKAANTV